MDGQKYYTDKKNQKNLRKINTAIYIYMGYMLFEDFKKRFTDENGDLVGYVLSVRDYETLALNMAEIKRYIEQQKEIIIYYEEAVKPRKKEEEEK